MKFKPKLITNIRWSSYLLIIVLCFTDNAALTSDQYLKNIRWIEVPLSNNQTIAQQTENTGCYYAAILNCLSLGNSANQKVFKSLQWHESAGTIKYLMSSYGVKPSKIYEGEQRQQYDGMANEDICETYNEIRQSHGLRELTGSYLNRNENETQAQLLTRIHNLIANSLKHGEPPLIILAAQVTKWHTTMEKRWWDVFTNQNPQENEYIWGTSLSHAVTVIGVPESANNDGSFCIDYIDPTDGIKRQLLLSSSIRDFGAYKGSRGIGDWLSHRGFLIASGGSLSLGTQQAPWSARTNIFLHYAIYKK